MTYRGSGPPWTRRFKRLACPAPVKPSFTLAHLPISFSCSISIFIQVPGYERYPYNRFCQALIYSILTLCKIFPMFMFVLASVPAPVPISDSASSTSNTSTSVPDSSYSSRSPPPPPPPPPPSSLAHLTPACLSTATCTCSNLLDEDKKELVSISTTILKSTKVDHANGHGACPSCSSGDDRGRWTRQTINTSPDRSSYNSVKPRHSFNFSPSW
jgi:hypothetical protein